MSVELRLDVNENDLEDKNVRILSESNSQFGDVKIDENLINRFKRDPLLKDLPEELLQYVVLPDKKKKIEQFYTKGNQMGWGCGFCLSFPTCGYTMSKMRLVEDGNIGLGWQSEIPVIYGPGRHFLLDCTHIMPDEKNVSDITYLKHGTIHIVNVSLGQVGIAVDTSTGLPIILASGQHLINSQNFVFDRFSNLLSKKTKIGVMELIRVELGDIGYGYFSDGDLMILNPGLHLVSPPARFENQISMQLNIVDLPPSINESKDYVQISVSAAVYYKVQDPVKCLTNIGGDILKKQIIELGIATLQQIIRSSTLVDIAGSEKVAYTKETGKDHLEENIATQAEGEVDFYEKVHDKFMKTIHGHVLKEWGVEISNIRIESLRIADANLAKSIAQSAIAVSTLESEHMMLDKRTKIITVRAKNQAKEIEIDVNAQADKVKRLAEADAQAMLIKAKAQKDAKILQGEGESEYSRLVQESGLGAELATLAIHQEAMKGVQQVIYVPHLPQMMSKSSPLLDSSMLMPKKQS